MLNSLTELSQVSSSFHWICLIHYDGNIEEDKNLEPILNTNVYLYTGIILYDIDVWLAIKSKKKPFISGEFF